MYIRNIKLLNSISLFILTIGILAPWIRHNPQRDSHYSDISPGMTWDIFNSFIKRVFFLILLIVIVVFLFSQSDRLIHTIGIVSGIIFSFLSLRHYCLSFLQSNTICLPTNAFQPGPESLFIPTYGFFIVLIAGLLLVASNCYYFWRSQWATTST